MGMLPEAVSEEGQNFSLGKQSTASAPSHLYILPYRSALKNEGKLVACIPVHLSIHRLFLGVEVVSVLNTED